MSCMVLLGAGVLVLAVGSAVCLACVASTSVRSGGNGWTDLHVNEEDWQFVAGRWQQSEEGVITAPENVADENMAICARRAYADFEAEFEFRWDIVWTNAGFIFRARDTRHYNMVHFPAVGQQYRAEHFWAAISKVGDSGFVQVLKMELVHGVSSSPRLWHKARVTICGQEIRAWVDGRPLPLVRDGCYAGPGYIGLATFSGLGATEKSSFRNLRIRGEAAEAPSRDPSVLPARNWFRVASAGGTGCGNIVRAPNGDLLVGVGEAGMLRSTDNGRSWGDPEPLPVGLSSGLLHAGGEGILTMQMLRSRPPFETLRAISTDNGKSWSEPVRTGAIVFPREKSCAELYCSRLLELRDGTLLMFAYGRQSGEYTVSDGRRYGPARSPGDVNICIRSEDGGESWSEPSNLDGPPYDDRAWMVPKDHSSEVSAAQTRDGSIVALIRPYSSPFMWESWSRNGGRTWTPAARGPFPMYACDRSMTSTASGALLIGGRFPGMAVQVSHDGGMTWRCYMIDSAIWANGAMFEVEPDVVLFLYGGKDQHQELRGQLLRVTSDGLEPVRQAPPAK